MSELDLDAIRERCEKATSGPWHVYLNIDPDRSESHGVGYRPADPMDCPSLTCGHLSEPDASFIAASREDVPALIAEVDRLRTLVASMKTTAVPLSWWSDDEPSYRARS